MFIKIRSVVHQFIVQDNIDNEITTIIPSPLVQITTTTFQIFALVTCYRYKHTHTMSTYKSEVLITGDSAGHQYNLAVWDPDTGTFLSSYRGKADFS